MNKGNAYPQKRPSLHGRKLVASMLYPRIALIYIIPKLNFFFLLPFPAEAKSREIGEISKSRQRELLLSGNGEGERGPEKKK